MEATYNLQAIVLSRQDFREYDSRVILYSLEKGKIELVARGTKRIKSKLAGHLEPLNFIQAMAIKGKQYDYIGSAIGLNSFLEIKKDLNKIFIVSEEIKNFSKLISGEEIDENNFNLLKEFIELENNIIEEKAKIVAAIFFYKVLENLGYKFRLKNCFYCKEKLMPEKNVLIADKGGISCLKCAVKEKNAWSQKVSPDTIKVLRLAQTENLKMFKKIKIDKKTEEEIVSIISTLKKLYL